MPNKVDEVLRHLFSSFLFGASEPRDHNNESIWQSPQDWKQETCERRQSA